VSVLLDIDSFISATPSLVDFGGVLTPALGGAEQRINRLGSRFQIAMVVDFDTDEEARRFGQRLRMAKREGALQRFVQIGVKPTAVGTPLVDGAVAGGTTLPIKGLLPGYALLEGQFFSIIVGGRRYLHSAAEQAIADDSGDLEITIDPALRISLAGNEVIEIAKPMIEGLVDGDEVSWEHASNSHEPFAYVIREMA
jgi:hypothetical protein